MKKLPGDYIAGFVDGEGCFALTFRRDVRHERGKRTGRRKKWVDKIESIGRG